MVRRAHQPWFDGARKGFFSGRIFSSSPKEYRAKEDGLAHAEAFCFCNHSKNPWRDFLNAGDLRGIGGAAKPLP